MSTLSRIEWRAVGTNCSAAVTTPPATSFAPASRSSRRRTRSRRARPELSRFRPESDLSRLNAGAGEWVPVGRRLLESLQLALSAREDTNGRFDPTVLPALVAAGYDKSFELLEERAAKHPIGWCAGAEIELDHRRGRARIEPGTAVDLGGIGKGYAAGRALDAMLRRAPSLRGGLVDLGGDIAVRGEAPEGGPWRIAVSDPRRPGETLAVLALTDGGVATSGRDARRFGPSRSLHHLIDPETGESALAGPFTVTVVAPDASEAEANATPLAIAGLAEAEAYVAARPQLSALYVPHAGPAVPLGRLPFETPRLVVSVG